MDIRRDIRTELPRLMADLGVNTENEHEVFHATLVWLVNEVAKEASPATVAEIASVIA